MRHKSFKKGTARDIAFLGMDGIGKSTIAKELKKQILSAGNPCKIVSVTKLHKEAESTIANILMSDISRLSYRCLLGFIQTGSSSNEKLNSHLFSQFEDIHPDELLSTSIESNDIFALISASLIEFSGGLLLKQSLEKDKMDVTSIYESWAYKHGIKTLFLAQYLGEKSKSTTLKLVNQHLIKAMTEIYSQINPAVGIYVTGNPELALKWRKESGGNFGPLEDCSIIGIPGEAGFLRLQSDTNEIFKTAAEKWGWITIEMQDQPLQKNLSMAMEIINEAIILPPDVRTF